MALFLFTRVIYSLRSFDNIISQFGDTFNDERRSCRYYSKHFIADIGRDREEFDIEIGYLETIFRPVG